MSPSSEALNSGNFFSVCTAALIMKASMLTLTPLFSFSLFICTRKASSSVMSASSWLVTCGIITQLRCRLAPEIFLIRDSGFDSMGPNLAKSTFGHGRRSMPPTPAPADAAADVGFAAPAPPLADLDVFLQDAALVAATLHSSQVHPQLSRELAHARSRIGEPERGLVDGAGGRRRRRGSLLPRGPGPRPACVAAAAALAQRRPHRLSQASARPHLPTPCRRP